MNERLKACPFCWSRRIVLRRDEEACWHACESCGATGPVMRKRDEEDAPDWNTRTVPDAIRGEVRDLIQGAIIGVATARLEGPKVVISDAAESIIRRLGLT